MADIKTKFGARLRTLRTNEGLSQEAFADLCGLHRTYIGAIERGERNISLENIEKIARALGVNIQFLFGRKRKSFIPNSLSKQEHFLLPGSGKPSNGMYSMRSKPLFGPKEVVCLQYIRKVGKNEVRETGLNRLRMHFVFG